MELYLNAINDKYLRNILENVSKVTERVQAAVAYATDESTLIDWCFKKNIPLEFYGRLDNQVPVKCSVLSKFLNKSSPNFTCSLVKQYFHAKVIWWHEYGVYIGSANLTDSAWNKNIEAGCFFPESEIEGKFRDDLIKFFSRLKIESTPLTNELYEFLKKCEKKLEDRNKIQLIDINEAPGLKHFDGLVKTQSKKVKEENRDAFLKEWYETLTILRDIGKHFSNGKNCPKWIINHSFPSVIADQFLQAHYYNNTFDGNKSLYEEHYNKNKSSREKALMNAIDWWNKLPDAPSGEGKMINETHEKLYSLFSQENIPSWNENDIVFICSNVHAIIEHCRHYSNKKLNLSETIKMTKEDKQKHFAHYLWNLEYSDGQVIKDLFQKLLYGGSRDDIPKRIWELSNETHYGLGKSTFGEIVGWAMPEKFPPRNNRTSKALRSLGYDVTKH
ncbi:MAG: phospholipase D family protein [Candidatus Symbiobacter sp.]|nr:phospholipase D family protein [Candidatus Symbiobacter sp.]